MHRTGCSGETRLVLCTYLAHNELESVIIYLVYLFIVVIIIIIQCVLQIVLAAVLSVAYGANTGQTTMGIVAMLHKITKSQAVPATADAGIVLHAMKTVAMLFGAIKWGGRLAPVTGTPCNLSRFFQLPSVDICTRIVLRNQNGRSTACHRYAMHPFMLPFAHICNRVVPMNQDRCSTACHRYAMHPFTLVSNLFCTHYQATKPKQMLQSLSSVPYVWYSCSVGIRDISQYWQNSG